jgi:hypothetical protein
VCSCAPVAYSILGLVSKRAGWLRLCSEEYYCIVFLLLVIHYNRATKGSKENDGPDERVTCQDRLIECNPIPSLLPHSSSDASRISGYSFQDFMDRTMGEWNTMSVGRVTNVVL